MTVKNSLNVENRMIQEDFRLHLIKGWKTLF